MRDHLGSDVKLKAITPARRSDSLPRPAGHSLALQFAPAPLHDKFCWQAPGILSETLGLRDCPVADLAPDGAWLLRRLVLCSVRLTSLVERPTLRLR